MKDALIDLRSHDLQIALLQPQIAPNTGNIGRLCAASACALHLVRPMGFVLSDRALRRSGMDYWKQLNVTVHDSTEQFLKAMAHRRLWLFDSSGQTGIWDVQFRDGDVLVFGSETRGIDPALLQACPSQVIRIPQLSGQRCLNLASAVAIATYEALRQLHALQLIRCRT